MDQPAAADSERVYSYDRIPYASHPFSDTHPDRLAAVARVFQLTAPSVERARVLELGSSSGGNIIPMAIGLPEGEFVGIDLSKVEIDLGIRVVERLGLKNVSLRHCNILDVDESFGKFDFIICHGVFSWVPPEVRDRILSICRDMLTPNGLAYISYNCYPGWHMMNIVRDMMLFHAGRFTDPQTQITQARSLLNFMARWVPAKENPFGDFIRREAESFLKRSDFYLYHEHLEDINEPMYFCEFAETAGKYGLEYLAETSVGSMLAQRLPAEAREALRVLAPDLLTMEQYLDFLRNRTFRRTILCRQGRGINRGIDAERIKDVFVSAHFKREEGPEDIRSKEPTKYKSAGGGGTLSTPEPVIKAAVQALTETWPGVLTFDELVAKVKEKLKISGNDERVKGMPLELSKRLMSCYFNEVIELNAHRFRCALSVAERPRASPLARLQADTTNQVTSLRHQILNVPEEVRLLLPFTDGTRDVAALAKEIAGRELSPAPGSPETRRIPDKADTVTRNCLAYMAKNALLMA